MKKIAAVVFDWAGTIVDFGSLAPMGAFVRLFARHGISISIGQARVPMGLPKLAHIEALAAMAPVAAQWQAVKGQSFGRADALALLDEFVPMSAESALANAEFSKQIEMLGMEPVSRSSPQEFREWVNAELTRWTKVVREAGITQPKN